MKEREKINNNELDKTVEELVHVFKDRPDLVRLAIEYLYFAWEEESNRSDIREKKS